MLPAEAPLHRLSYEDVLRMFDAGILRGEDRVELLDGVLVDVTRPSPGHSAVVGWLTNRLVGGVGAREVRVQDVLLVTGGFVSPDVLVIDAVPRDRHPSTAALAIEVAVTTQRHDRSKALRYARAGVPEYWIVDGPARAVELYRSPSETGYAERTHYVDGEQISSDAVETTIDVSAMLG